MEIYISDNILCCISDKTNPKKFTENKEKIKWNFSLIPKKPKP